MEYSVGYDIGELISELQLCLNMQYCKTLKKDWQNKMVKI